MKHKKIKAAVLAITAISALGGILYSQFGTKKSYDYADYYVETKPAKNNTSDKEASEKELSLSLLKQTNKDIVGILVFDDRVIYEPIVQAPDNDFYVRRNIEKQYANAGIPFVSADGNIDSQNVVIYGHSSKWNNIIFTPLMSYIDENYYLKHPTFEFITENGTRTYKIFDVMNIDLNNLNDSLEFTQSGWDTSNEFNAFISDSINRGLYKTGETSYLITLKTIKHMKFSTKAATFLSSIKTQTYDKKESEMIITYQQKRVFHLSLLMLALCAPIYIYSVPFPNEQFYYINSVLFLFIIMCTLAYFKKRVNLTTTFSIILIAIHIEIFIEIIYCSICSGYEYSYQRALIMSNITISLLFTMLSICAYMSNISILLSSLTIASYTICTLITDEPFLYSYLPLIIIIYTMIPLLGRSLHSNISSLLKSSNLLKEEEEMLLKRLQMKKEELFAFAELLSENNPEEKTSSLLNIIGEQSKENLFTALAAYQKKEKSKLDTIRRIYPNLSPSELNICRLILQDKTVSQICELLHRSSGNITSQRANIRAKLGLKKSDNLKEALQERMRLYEEEHHRQEEFSAMR